MKKRARDYGIKIGRGECGALNKITDVPGVRVGHKTLSGGGLNTGVTVILPSEENIFANKLVAASYIHNGFGKSVGTVQIDELGTLESPIALTNTLNCGIVSDALVGYMTELCKRDGIQLRSINTVVGECNDSRLSDITRRAVTGADVLSAISSACLDFEEGAVGAGRGTVCYGLKGGIGSASRIVKLDGRAYTVGVLVQSNYGSTADLTINGVGIGERIAAERASEGCDKGSIMMILATDIPLTSRQLKRVLKRCSVGIARLGSYIGHGSGEVFFGFSSANIIPHDAKSDIVSIGALNENRMNSVFRAVGEASEEAILNSMLTAEAVCGGGERIESLSSYMHLMEEK